MKLVASVLAAGGSRRLGSPKQLVEFRGEPLVIRATSVAKAAVESTSVVLGANRDRISPLLDGGGCVVLINEEWEEGMASSVRAATHWARSVDADALLLHLVDQPHVDVEHLRRLIAAHASGAPLVGSSYGGVIGAPALFSATYFDELLALTGDRGAAPILRAHPEAGAVPGPAGALDVDTPEDVQRLATEATETSVKPGSRNHRP